jgi:hypothetical protein
VFAAGASAKQFLTSLNARCLQYTQNLLNIFGSHFRPGHNFQQWSEILTMPGKMFHIYQKDLPFNIRKGMIGENILNITESMAIIV